MVLEGHEQTSASFDATTDEAWRTEHPEWFGGLRRAPVVLLAYTSPNAYVARYAEPDKTGSGWAAAPGSGRSPTGSGMPHSA